MDTTEVTSSTKMLISGVAVVQMQALCDKIQEKRSSAEEADQREAKSCVDELLGKLELALALCETVEGT